MTRQQKARRILGATQLRGDPGDPRVPRPGLRRADRRSSSQIGKGALLKQLKIDGADVFGYSMGGEVGLALAIRHPEAVGRLAILGSTTDSMKNAYERETYEQFLSITPENFNYPEVNAPYVKVAPDPGKWPHLVRRIMKTGRNFQGYTKEQVKGIKVPVLIMMGDREGIRPEHAVEMYRTIPNAQLTIFPGADHFLLFTNPDTILATLVPFFDASATKKQQK